ncbi:hypothetical protein VFPPC_17380 [Pochonia chlamydosporia 170]|uniref:Uncharacterized protein n=1 Tax=Pochonia chlamydosporia 170 TaxID=1380566 RepID=A0A219ARR9_METCM|nr:hypothetical protein VFPPC_17380 [Pochonia chlamydosporia 170]OWT43471.1 hypothetical protein VFPPC_17380 [Pochonia chlamydosporia 170]
MAMSTITHLSSLRREPVAFLPISALPRGNPEWAKCKPDAATAVVVPHIFQYVAARFAVTTQLYPRAISIVAEYFIIALTAFGLVPDC